MLEIHIAIATAIIGTFLASLNYLEKYVPLFIIYLVSLLLGIGWVIYISLDQGFVNTLVVIPILIVSYFDFPFPEKSGVKYKEIIQELKEKGVKVIHIQKNKDRIFLDISFSSIFVLISVLYFIFGPPSVFEFILLFGLISLVYGIVKRIRLYRTLHVFFEQEENALYFVSANETKKYPIKELTDINIQTRPDILKLFNLFTMFSSNKDFTTCMGKTLKLSFSGENVYFTPEPSDVMFLHTENHSMKIDEVDVKPFYHKENWKRLLGKWYFALTIKGVGAYAIIIVFLTFIHANPYVTGLVVIMFWLFNMWISDRILKMVLDMKEINDPNIHSIVNKVLNRAGIPYVKVYSIESTDYNGFAIGANIGQSLIALTTQTLKLPHDAIEGILAHEAIHVKKRDVLFGQLLRILMVVITVVGLLYLHSAFPYLFKNQILIFLIIWLIIILLLPLLNSFSTQWMEVRADHLGATLLDGGNDQMANSLAALYEHQLSALENSKNYDVYKLDDEEIEDEEKDEKIHALERETWFFRLLGFQFGTHPPMYWRVESLRSTNIGWNMRKMKLWLKDRLIESLPDMKSSKR